MERNHEGAKRQFVHLSRAWYGKANLVNFKCTDRIQIGFYSDGGGTSGEFIIEWKPLCGKETPCLHVFDDAWDALYRFSDVLAKMAERDSEDITPREMCKLLVSCGVEDATPEEESHA
jgi:hypothetical protein